MRDEKNEETGKPQETELREEQLEEASGGLGSISSQLKTSESLVEGSIQGTELEGADELTSGTTGDEREDPDDILPRSVLTCVTVPH